MAAENGTPPKNNQGTGESGAREPEVISEPEAEATPEAPPDAAGPAEPDVAAASATSSGAEPAPESEVPAASDGAAMPAAAAPEPAGGRPGIVALLIAGVVGGAAALALGYGLQVAGVLPSPGETAANEARAETEALKDTVSGLDQRVTSIEAASAQAIADRALLDDLSRQVGVVDAFGESLSDRVLQAEAAIAALNEDGGDDTSDMQQTLESLSKRVMSLETAPPPAATGDADMQQRLDALSERVARLEEPPSSVPSAPASAPESAPAATTAESAPSTAPTAAPAVDDAAARATAIAAFVQAAASGGPFADAFDALDALKVDPQTVAALKPLAEKGAPSRAELTAAFPGVAEAILAAKPAASEDTGLFDRLASYGRSLVKVRPAGSDDRGAIVARMKAAVDAGDFAEALDERKTLPADGQVASQAWADAVADRLEIDRLAEAIATPTDTGNSSG